MPKHETTFHGYDSQDSGSSSRVEETRKTDTEENSTELDWTAVNPYGEGDEGFNDVEPDSLDSITSSATNRVAEAHSEGLRVAKLASERATQVATSVSERATQAKEFAGTQYEAAKASIAKNGRTAAAKAIENGTIGLGYASLGIQGTIARGKGAIQNVKDRYAKFKKNREIKGISKLRNTYDKAKVAEANRLERGRKKNPDTFNRELRGNSLEQAAQRKARSEKIESDHEEALATKAEEDAAAEERREVERRAKERAEYDATVSKVEDFLKQFKGRKDKGFTEVRQELRSKFGKEMAGDQHISDAVEDAFDVFAGKKMKKAARAERIAQSRAKAKELRTKAYESTRDAVRDSETYQRASSRTRKIGRAVVRFASRSLGAARAAKAAWQESAPKPTTESEPTDNE